MARRRHGRRHKQSFKIPVVTLAILGGQAAIANASGSTILEKLHRFQEFYTGVDFYQEKFVPSELLIGYGPWLVKGLVHKVARPLGALPRVPMGLPFSIN